MADQEGSGDEYDMARGSGLALCLPVGSPDVAGLLWSGLLGSSVSCLLEDLSFVPRVTSQWCVLNWSLFLVGLQRE